MNIITDNDLKWHIRFLELAKHISTWSKDPSTKVGAVIVDPETKQIVGTGYNGFPRGVDDSEERYADRETKYKLVVHAELNAILNANKFVRGCDIYVYPTMMIPNSCPECCKAIAQSGIKRLFGFTPTEEASRHTKWKDLEKYSKIIQMENGFEMILIGDPNRK